MKLRSIYSLLSKPALLLTREFGLWFALIAGWCLSVHFCHLPKQAAFLPSLANLALTCCVLAMIVQVLPLAFRQEWRRWVRGILRTIIIIISVAPALVESFISRRFHMTFDPTIFCLIGETNAEESGEFLSLCLSSSELLQMWPYLCVILVPTIVFLTPHDRIHYPHHYARLLRGHCRSLVQGMRLAATIGMISLVIYAAPSWGRFMGDAYRFFTLTQSSQAERVSSKPYFTSFLRLAYSLKYYSLALHESDVLAENTLALFSTPAASSSCESPDIIVIIGESYNKHHAAIYGYEQPTTPCMLKMQNEGSLTAFTDALTPWNITSQALKWIMSSESIDSGRGWENGVLWPALFRHAGWQVAFLTNQYVETSTKKNKIDMAGSFFLNAQPLDSLAFDFRNRRKYHYDEEMLTELDSIALLYDDAKPHLTIMQLIGQHLEAKNRVPESWCKLKEERYSRPDLSPKELAQLVAYDNATLYNDYVFSQICARFAQRDAVVIYFSDHGEEVLHPDQKMYGRNHAQNPNRITLQSEYEIPLLIWTSPSCRTRHPELCARIAKSSDRPFMSDDVSHLALGIAGINHSYYNQKRDLLSESYDHSRPRLIRGRHKYALSNH